jgi:hypothetical protein
MSATSGRVGTALGLCALMLAGCEGKKDPSGPDSPVISNLGLSSAALASCRGSQSVESLELDYADPNGDVSGGHVEVRLRVENVGTVDTFNVEVPSDHATITGTTSGRITLSICIDSDVRDRFHRNLTARVRLFDAAGNGSNERDVDL